MEQLAAEGMTWKDGNSGWVKRTRVVTTVCIADTVCRPMIRNCTQFNGHFGCDWCYHPGVTVAKGQGHARVYPYEDHSLRTNDEHHRHAHQAVEEGVRVSGVKGPSVLMRLPHFNIITGFTPDYMHAVLLGICRQMTTLWFDSSYHQSPWYIGRSIERLDKQLLAIRPPHEITRRPRSLKTRRYFKANEWRAFLLFYSTVILEGVLGRRFKRHWDLVVAAIHALLKDEVKTTSVDIAERQLSEFVEQMEDLYGVQHLSFNIHQLMHLSQSVRNWGPLWAISGFTFEDQNGVLLKFVKGTQYVPEQIYNQFVLKMSLPSEANKKMAGATPPVCSMYAQLT